MREYTDDWAHFEALCGQAKKLSDALPSVVVEAIYHDQAGMGGTPSGREIWDDIRKAVQSGFLENSDGDEVVVNYNDRKVKRYLHAVEDVRLFLNGGGENPVGPGFYDEYEDGHDHQPSFESRRLWEEHLGLSNYTQW